MTNRKIAIGAALLAAVLLAILLIQHQSVLAARAAQAELQARLRELTNVTSQTTKPVLDAEDQSARVLADLERLRVEAAALRARVAQFIAQGHQWAAANPGQQVLRASDARDVGFATPAAMMQTFLWAFLQGDTNRVSQSLVFDAGVGPTQAQEVLATIMEESADMRKEEQDGDLDKLAVQLLGQKPAENADQWIVVNVDTEQDATNSHPLVMLTRPTDSGWGLVIGTNCLPVTKPVEEQVQPRP